MYSTFVQEFLIWVNIHANVKEIACEQGTVWDIKGEHTVRAKDQANGCKGTQGTCDVIFPTETMNVEMKLANQTKNKNANK